MLRFASLLLRGGGTAAALAFASAAGSAAEERPTTLPDTFLARVEALASMQSLNAAILGSASATVALEGWCGAHALAAEPKIVAVRVPGPERAPDAEQRRRLEIGPDEPVRYRHVHLTCGSRVLSDAENWYVPSRLTPAMNAALAGTDAPFGKVVMPLHPSRRTVAATVLWSVLPPGWELRAPQPDGAGALPVPPVLFEHRAVLYDGERRPFCEVAERYTRENLAFGAGAMPGR